MKLVIDANILISILIKPGKTIDVFFMDKLDFFAPNLLFEEVENNMGLIIKKSMLSIEDLMQIIKILRRKVTIISEIEFLDYREDAIKICPDPKDLAYFALALYMKCPIWTNERRLRNQDKIEIYSTQDIIGKFFS
ncbi:MAG: PIN domain-containing protein [Candidatus Woesearchaeota archaeon]